MSQLKMPKKGESARMLQELQAEHAADAPTDEPEVGSDATHVTTLQDTHETTGAGAHADTNADANAATSVTTIEPSRERSNDPSAADTPIEDTATRRERSQSPPAPVAPRSRRSTERDERLAHALRRGAEDEITVVTVRVSASLNRYMDDYTARVNRIDPKRKYRKQDAVLEAFAAFYADHPMPPAPEEEAL